MTGRRDPKFHVVPWLFTIAAALIMGLPFYWMAITALKAPAEVFAYPTTWWPEAWRWQNFAEAWRAAPFGRFYLNSLVAAAGTTAANVVFSLTMAYAFVFIPAKGSRVLFVAIVATLLVPDEVKLIPNYLLSARLGWIDSYAGLIVPPIANAFPVFVFTQVMKTIPRDLLDAARVDGAGHGRTLLRVVIPLMVPMIAAVALITFIGRWNDYLWPLVITDSAHMRTLPVGLAYLREAGEAATPWHLLMAGSVFVIIPVLLLFVVAQRQFVAGITQGALKG